MHRLRRSLSGVAPVGFAVLLAAFCAGGTELYVSATASAATGQQFAEACPSDAALLVPVPLPIEGSRAQVEQIVGAIPHVQPPRLGGQVRVSVPHPSGPEVPLRLIQLDGLTLAGGTDPLPELGPGEMAMTETNAAQMRVEVGAILTTEVSTRTVNTGFGTDPVPGPDLRLARIIPDVPTAPVPVAWCGLASLVLPTVAGDLPPVSAVVSPETMAMFGQNRAEFLEMRLVQRPLTLTEAKETLAGYRAAMAAWNAAFAGELPAQPNGFPDRIGELPGDLAVGLAQIVGRADGVATTVQRSLAPVRVTSLVAVFGVLLASAVLLARERRRELRLLGIRGVSPLRVAWRMAPEITVTALLAAVAGCALAWGVVAAFAPSSLLEPAALARGWLLAAAVAVVSVLAVLAAVAVAANHVVDRATHRTFARFALPFVALALCGLALWSYRRLDAKGGIRTFGVEVRGGELLALGFPLFALLAGTVVACTVIGPLAAAARHSGSRLPRAMRLGWRRVVLEAGPTVATVAAVALAAGSFVAASALSEGARRQLVDKADVYVGSDLAVNIYDDPNLPADVAARSTFVLTADGKVDGKPVDLYGIDPATFAGVARLRDDASSRSLAELVGLIGQVGQVGQVARGLPAALAVGRTFAAGDTVSVALPGTDVPLVVQVVGTVPFFPGKATNIDELVMQYTVVDAALPFPQRQLLVRDPPPGLVQSLRDDGVRVGVVLDAATTFDASSFSGLRWAYLPLRVLGLLFAIVAAAVQFLVVAARRVTRRAAQAIQQRTGFGRRSLWVAAVTEAVVPLAVGAALGLGVGLYAVGVAVPLLDPMPLLAPRARFLVPWPTVLGIVLAVPLWAAVTAALIVRSTTTGDPMRALRGEQ
ncbi:MAG: hypothetical protein Q7V88_17130 [Actinomycetota bacterium]|nr:hypothetical protein [Actinomycetota bacterium]